MSETAAISSRPPAAAAPKAVEDASTGADGSFKHVMDQVATDKRPASAGESEPADGSSRAESADKARAKEAGDGKGSTANADPAANPAAALPLPARLLPVQTENPQAAAGEVQGKGAVQGAGASAAGIEAAHAAGAGGGLLKQALGGFQDKSVPAPAGGAAGETAVNVETNDGGAREAASAKHSAAIGQATDEKRQAKSTGAGEFSLDTAGDARSAAPERPVTEAAAPAPSVVGGTSAPPALRAERLDAATLVQATPVTHPRFGEVISQQILVLAQDGVQHAKITLNPPELGPVEVRISLRQDEATIQLAAASGVTRHAIEDALPKLRDMLDQVGVRLGDTGVFAQLPQNGGTENRGDWRPDRTPLFGATADLDEEALLRVGPLGRASLGLVDAYV